MKISIEATSKLGYKAAKEELNLLSGRMAGMCYMKGDLQALRNEPKEDTLKRAEKTKQRLHHSVFDHAYISLALENVPKLFAMLLNNEKMYVTSEKSARYTKMILPKEEEELYQKWYEKMKFLIIEHYGGSCKFFTPGKVDTLAQENARYFTSVMTPTNMEYTVILRQLNYLCAWMKEFKNKDNSLYKMLAPYAEEFVDTIQKFGYLDEDLMKDGKNRDFSLVAKRARQEQFGELYSVNYQGSMAMLAQAQRHRTLNYEILLPEKNSFFVPKILLEYPNLVDEWLNDMEAVENRIPQASLVNINESGKYENLILKAKERLCSCAQLEVMLNTKETIEKIITNTDNEFVKKDLEEINKGARCVSGFKCNTPCAFKEGIDLTRSI